MSTKLKLFTSTGLVDVYIYVLDADWVLVFTRTDMRWPALVLYDSRVQMFLPPLSRKEPAEGKPLLLLLNTCS